MNQFSLIATALPVLLTLMIATTVTAETSPDARAGKKHFIRCNACHSTSSDARPLTGPHLEGIVGRRAAAVEGFNYTERLRAQGFVWDEALASALVV